MSSAKGEILKILENQDSKKIIEIFLEKIAVFEDSIESFKDTCEIQRAT